MGRLDNIIARNRRPRWTKDPVVRAIAIAVAVAIVFALVAFTDLARPARPARPDHVDGVYLRSR